MRNLLDRVRTVKDLVSSILAALAGAGYPVIDDSTQAAIWTAVFGVASLVVTLFAGGNDKVAPAHRQ